MSEILIYLLDDCEEDVYLLKRMLTKKGLDNLKIQDFSSLDALKRGITVMPPDVIVTDLNLPESKGLNTMVQLRKFAAAYPIIVLTGYEEDNVGFDAIQLGAQDFIPKSELTESLFKRSVRFSRERFNLLKGLEEKSIRDPLTLMPNREAFYEKLNETVSEAERYQTSFGLLFFDINDFKEINDTYGHIAGDQVIKSISARLNLFKRASDFVARYAGDEFVLIAKNISDLEELKTTAQNKYELLRDKYNIESLDETVLSLEVSVSVGAALYGSHGCHPADLLDEADKAMYQGKVNGIGWALAPTKTA